MPILDIPAAQAVSVKISQGQKFRIVNSRGSQVVDTWALNLHDFDEALSMAHCHSATYRIEFQPGDVLVTNRFFPILDFINDTSPGHYDTLHAACSPGSYRHFGYGDEHPNCQQNLIKILREKNYSKAERHASMNHPWNLFEHTEILDSNQLIDQPASAKAGDYVELRALMDILLICSACPSSVGNISAGNPRGAQIHLFDDGFALPSGPL